MKLSTFIRATRVSLAERTLIAQSDHHRYPLYRCPLGCVSPAGAAGVDGDLLVEEILEGTVEKKDLLKIALIEHCHDVWLFRNPLSVALERMEHPSRLPPKLYNWLVRNKTRMVDEELFREILDRVSEYA